MPVYAKNIIAGVLILGVIGAILALEFTKDVKNLSEEDIAETTVQTGGNNMQKDALYARAKDISTPDVIFNAPEDFSVSKALAEGQVVLIDFWTYSCINCQRTLPYLNSWHERYRDDGLVIVGVHTPEFEFEKDEANVARAIEKWGIEYPVVMDNDYSTWQSYRNNYWPRKYLIDIDGYVVYDHIGEGAYDETENKIVELLNERAERLGLDPVTKKTQVVDADEVDFSRIGSRETYLGAQRIEYVAEGQRDALAQCAIGVVCSLSAPETIPVGYFAFDGDWIIEDEFARSVSSSAKITIHFSASKANLVMGSEKKTKIELTLDGEDLGTVTVKDEDLYNLVDLEGEYGAHILEVTFPNVGVEAFAFTFG